MMLYSGTPFHGFGVSQYDILVIHCRHVLKRSCATPDMPLLMLSSTGLRQSFRKLEAFTSHVILNLIKEYNLSNSRHQIRKENFKFNLSDFLLGTTLKTTLSDCYNSDLVSNLVCQSVRLSSPESILQLLSNYSTCLGRWTMGYLFRS